MKLTGDDLYNETQGARRLRRLYLSQEEIEEEEMELLFYDIGDEMELYFEKAMEELLNEVDERGEFK